MEGVPGMNRGEILSQISHEKSKDEGAVYLENQLRRKSAKGMMLCLMALMFYSIWAGTSYYDLMALFWLYGGIAMFSAYRIGKMKSYLIISILEFAVAAYSAYLYIRGTWPLL